MGVPVRTYCVAGIATMAAGVITFTPSIVPTQPDITVPAVEFTGAQAPSPELIRWLEALQQSAATVAPATAATAAVGPAPQNTASDLVTAGYQFIQYWVDYGVELAQWGVGFIPFIGPAIGAQIGFFYWDLIRPISDSVVYDLINPVLNNPLNLAVWWNGIVAVGIDSVNALINFAWNELNYFIPLPPLPGAAVTASRTTASSAPAEINSIPSIVKATLAASDTAIDAARDEIASTADTAAAAFDGVRQAAESVLAAAAPDLTLVTTPEPQPEPETAAESDETELTSAPKESVPTTVAKGVVSAQGEVRSLVTEGLSRVTTRTADKRAKAGERLADVAASLTDGVQQAVKNVERAGSRLSDAAKAAASGDSKGDAKDDSTGEK